MRLSDAEASHARNVIAWVDKVPRRGRNRVAAGHHPACTAAGRSPIRWLEGSVKGRGHTAGQVTR